MTLPTWLRGLLRRERAERELDDELDSFLALLIEEKLHQGHPPAEARRLALLECGGVEQVKEECRDVRPLSWLDVLARDLRYGLRLLLRNPGFAATVVLTLGLGIGATTAIFSVVHATLLRPLPYSHPERLVYIKQNVTGYGPSPFSRPKEARAWLEQSRTLSDVGAYIGARLNVTGMGEAQRLNGGIASASFFRLMGTRPAAGRLFVPEEDRPGSTPVTLISYGLWRGRFGADPGVVGRRLTVDGRRYTIAGVLPQSFRVPDRYGFDYDLWLSFADSEPAPGLPPYMAHVVGRLAPGVTVATAQDELDRILQPAQRRPGRAHALVVPWQEEIASGVRTSLLIFLGAVGFLLLIACVNVAILLLSRAAAREREISIRLALGAGRARIVRQLLTESVLMALAGAAAGLGIAYWGKDLLGAFLSENLPTMDPVQLDYRILAFNLGLGLLTGVAFGLAPALQAVRTREGAGLHDTARGASESRTHHRVRNVLVVVQVALAVTLTIGAGLLARSFFRLSGLDLGFRSGNLLTLSVNLTPSDYPDAARQASYFEQALTRVRGLGGVESAAVNCCLPLGDLRWSVSQLKLDGRTEPVDQTDLEVVSPDYFRTMRVPWRQGRAFTAADKQGAPYVAVVNETFARRFCPEGHCLGRRIEHWSRPNETAVIVGVAGDTHGSAERPVEPVLYASYLQSEVPSMTMVIRTAGEPMGLAAAVRTQLLALDHNQPPHSLMSMDDLRARWIAPLRADMLLLAVFAGLALLLGSIGIYGVVAYTANRRTHEIGIRMALGARPGDVLSLITGRTLLLIAAGELLGAAAALALNKVLRTLVVDIPTTDARTYAGACLLWTAVALLACYLPARQGVRTDPILTLRSE